MYNRHSKQRSRPSLDGIFGVLQSVCSNYAVVDIVVDALDQCADKDGRRNQLIDKLRELQARTDVRLLSTSRFIPEISQKFFSYLTLEVRASEKDVRRYVVGPVDSLLDKKTKQKVLSTLGKLSKGSATLDETYNDAIRRMDGQLAEDGSLATRALSWITYAQRLLTTKELCHALAIDPSDKALNSDNVSDVEDIISVCARLVTVDEESNIIRLVHYTTQEYFGRLRGAYIHSRGHVYLAVIAIPTYLSFDTFRSGSCADDKAFEQRLAKNTFFNHSAHSWSKHIRPVEKITSHLALAFLCDEALFDCTIQAVSTSEYKYRGYSRSFPNRTSGPHLTARYALVYLTERLLIGKHGDNIGADSKDGHGRTPLSWAARNGHEAIVKLLQSSIST
ncbi:hypothetical protein K469DRAFT_673892 [Zopfia rhizophila CBS 207.26]|uniref:GPI inositol-deacylase winged helix domain-containing protein n=1 Tax=Zopfia rhizophila CBS 207.26 TaxID=1314779 RepID=A0A6A6DMY7_9PEZI|nr:hypothetical protein K469DRAFT_673892 [Zopfia rhizophila CBS 207.26]